MRPLFAFISLPIIPEQTNKKPNLHPPSCRKHEIRPCRAMQSRHNFAPWQFFHTFAPDFPKTHFVHERQSKRIYLRSHRRSHLRDEPIVCPSALQRRDDSRLCLIFPLSPWSGLFFRQKKSFSAYGKRLNISIILYRRYGLRSRPGPEGYSRFHPDVHPGLPGRWQHPDACAPPPVRLPVRQRY